MKLLHTVSNNFALYKITLHCTNITCGCLRKSSAHLRDLSRSAAFPASDVFSQQTSEEMINLKLILSLDGNVYYSFMKKKIEYSSVNTFEHLHYAVAV